MQCIWRRLLATVTACVSLSLVPVAHAENDGLRNPCVANIIGALGQFGNDNTDHLYTEGTIFDTPPQAIAHLIQAPHSPANKVLLAIPLDEPEYKSIFRVDGLSQADSAQVARARRLADSFRLRATRTVRNRAEFDKFLRSTTEKYVIIAGHNENGQFMFFGGEGESLPTLGEDCAKIEKICIFISCKSKDYLKDGSVGVRRDLTLAEGVWIVNEIQRWLSEQQHDVSLNQVAAYIRTVEAQALVKYHVSYFAIGACTAAGTGAAAYLIVEGAGQSNG